MKKFLLLSMTACAVLSASALNVKTLDANVNKAPISLTQNKVMAPKTYAQIATNVFNKKANNKVRAKLPTADNMYGMYVCDNTELGDGTTEFTKSASLNFIEANQIDEDGTVYNVEIEGFFGYGSVLGSFDETTGLLRIPAQYCYKHPEYGQIVFYALTEADPDANQYSVAMEFDLQLEEDENGAYFVPTEEYIGFCTAFDEGQYAGSLADLCYNGVTVMPANYIVQGESTNQIQGDSPWEDVDDYGVCLERVGDDAMFIHGFMGMGTVEVKFDENGAGTIETYQPLEYGRISQTEWAYIGPVAWDVTEDSMISVNNDREQLYCGWYTFTSNATGEQFDGFALYNENSPVGWEYYSLGIKGMSGGFAPLTVLTLMVDNPNMPFVDTESIRDLKVTKPAAKGTFNLAGQRVRNAKGIVIEDGKKVVR